MMEKLRTRSIAPVGIFSRSTNALVGSHIINVIPHSWMSLILLMRLWSYLNSKRTRKGGAYPVALIHGFKTWRRESVEIAEENYQRINMTKNKLSKQAKELLHCIPLGGQVVKSQLADHLGITAKNVGYRLQTLKGDYMRRTHRKVGKERVWRRVA